MLNHISVNSDIEHVLILTIICFLCFCVGNSQAMTDKRRLELKDLTREMFHHGWNNYMQNAYPEDELNPFQCNGRGSDKANPSNINVNDVLGDYSLTLVDNLDTLAILGSQEEFEEAVRLVIETVSFSQDNKVQVFELNIRALGGLLSAHLLAIDPNFNRTIDGYNHELLDMAVNLADRLMPAFTKSTKTGIPFPRVNLKRGVPPTETTETCTAGAGSLILEFGVLSRLTGNPSYELAAKHALNAVWQRRSNLNLLGNVIDIQSGHWIHTASSTGAGIDSIFEYMLKAHVLFGQDEYKDMFDQAYRALLLYVRDSTGYLYRNVHMSTGSLMSYWIDSLSAFFPGLQVLHGDLDAAIKNHLVYYNIWKRYHALPERFDFFQKTVDLPFYPLRPEFIESTYHLYQATKDPFYLDVGEMVIQDLNNRTRVPCGFASIGDVRSGRLEDRMESFMLSETLKYLYLLFDTKHALNTMDSNYVFTTEGHVLPLPNKYLRHQSTEKKKKAIVSLQSTPSGTCQYYNPLKRHFLSIPGDLEMTSIPYQPQTDYASNIVGYTPLEPVSISKQGYCLSPTIASKSHSLSFGYTLPDQHRFFHQPQNNNLIDMLGGYLVKSLSGLRLEISGTTGKGDGYLVKGVYPPSLSVDKHDMLTIPLHVLYDYMIQAQDVIELAVQHPHVTTRIRSYLDSDDETSIQVTDTEQCQEYIGLQTHLGPRYRMHLSQAQVHVFSDTKRFHACEPFSSQDAIKVRNKVLLVSRGQCNFYEKVVHAQQAGARAVILMNNKQERVSKFRVIGSGPIAIHIPSVLISYQDGLYLIHQRSNRPILGMDINHLPSIDNDPSAVIQFMLLGKRVENIVILNV